MVIENRSQLWDSSVVVFFYLPSRYMRPEGPWQLEQQTPSRTTLPDPPIHDLPKRTKMLQPRFPPSPLPASVWYNTI